MNLESESPRVVTSWATQTLAEVLLVILKVINWPQWSFIWLALGKDIDYFSDDFFEYII